MIWANAQRISAGSVQPTFWSRTVCKFVGKAMRHKHAVFAVAPDHKSRTAIVRVDRSGPGPALSAHVNVFPESRGNRFGGNSAAMASGVTAGKTAIPIPSACNEIRLRSVFRAADGARDDGELFSVDPVVFLGMAIRAQEQEPFGMYRDFREIGAPGFSVALSGVMKVQRTPTGVVAASLARTAERVNEIIAKAIMFSHTNSYLRTTPTLALSV